MVSACWDPFRRADALTEPWCTHTQFGQRKDRVMPSRSWLRSVLTPANTPAGARNKQRSTRRLCLDRLEDRLAPAFFTTNGLPPLNGVYASPATAFTTFANGIILKNLTDRAFTQNQPPPPPPFSQTQSFGST